MTSLAPMLNHIRQHQDAWAANDILIKKTEERLDRIEGLLTTLKHLRQKGLEDTWPQDFKARLDRLESQQGDLLKKMEKFDKKIVPPKFELIGSRFFYIEGEIRKNWSAAANTCRQMGTQLANKLGLGKQQNYRYRQLLIQGRVSAMTEGCIR